MPFLAGMESWYWAIYQYILFAYTGLKINISLLSSFDDLLLTLIICLIAFVGKFGGTYTVSRLFGESKINSLIIGFSMNTRALMELIVLNIGYDLGILPQKIFSMFVVMAVMSTFMITPIIKHLIKKSDATVTPEPLSFDKLN